MGENSNSSSVPGGVGALTKTGGKEMRRDEHVRVRLVHASKGNAVQVKLTAEEKDALVKVADLLGYERGLSTFMRQLGLEAAAGFTGEAEDRITAAADEAGMVAGEWLRTVALAAIGFTPLRAQLELAHTAYHTAGRLPHHQSETAKEEDDAYQRRVEKTALKAKKGKRRR